MRPKNDSIKFINPRAPADIDKQMLDYYLRNTHVRSVDVDEDPIPPPANTNANQDLTRRQI